MIFHLEKQPESYAEFLLDKKNVIDFAPVPIVVSTADEPSSYLYCNQAYIDLVGYSRDIIGKASLVDSAAIDDGARAERLMLLSNHGGYRSSPSKLRHAAGRMVDVIISAQRLVLGGQACDIEVMTDIGGVIETYQRQVDDARAAARMDQLTGILNRQGFEEALTRHRLGLNGDTDLAIGILDLDGFKRINDTHGHLVGDRVLREFARRLSESLEPGADVARFGGDEFIVLLPIPREKKWSCESYLFNRLAAILTDFQIAGVTMELGASLGVAYASEVAWIVEEAILIADKRMYATKRGPGPQALPHYPPMI